MPTCARLSLQLLVRQHCHSRCLCDMLDTIVCGCTAGLLTSLHNETPPSEVSPSAVGRLEAGYEPPSESQLLADGLIEPVSLEMDAESDDELDALSEMYDPENKGDGTHRYTLLRELWSSAR